MFINAFHLIFQQYWLTGDFSVRRIEPPKTNFVNIESFTLIGIFSWSRTWHCPSPIILQPKVFIDHPPLTASNDGCDKPTIANVDKVRIPTIFWNVGMGSKHNRIWFYLLDWSVHETFDCSVLCLALISISFRCLDLGWVLRRPCRLWWHKVEIFFAKIWNKITSWNNRREFPDRRREISNGWMDGRVGKHGIDRIFLICILFVTN